MVDPAPKFPLQQAFETGLMLSYHKCSQESRCKGEQVVKVNTVIQIPVAKWELFLA